MIPYWLPVLDDWRRRIRALEQEANAADLWTQGAALARHRLSGVQIERLDRLLVERLGAVPPTSLATEPICLAMLGSSTVNHLFAAIRVAASRRGLWTQVVTHDYGNYRQALAGDGLVSDAHPTVCLLAFEARHVLAGVDPLVPAGEAKTAVVEIIDDLKRVWQQARKLCRGQVIQQTLLPVLPPLVGQNEHQLPGAPAALVGRVNERLRDAAADEGVDLLSVDLAVQRDGIDQWHDPALWHRAKQDVAIGAAPAYGELVARLLAAAQGRSAKCVVLDLDNTLWGGVIGDDGLDGIAIGQGSAAGEAFAAFQAYVADLSRRGVIVALCSKNDEAVAMDAIDRHPDMVLRRRHVVATRINWTDKATNLRALAQDIGIGLDAMVFVDDNPYERNLVRAELPMVAVPELPDDPALFARCLADGGYFEALTITGDDLRRSRQYADNVQRSEAVAAASDLPAYLRSLGMRLRWRRIGGPELKRAVQLVNKTNQFNLTTYRHGEMAVAAFADDPHAVALQFRLIDRFGDNGVIAIMLGCPAEDGAMEIDTWVMSCRVLGRRVEEATLAVFAQQATALGKGRLAGRYRASGRNAMVAELYPRLEFREDETVACDDVLGRRFVRDATPTVADLPFTVEEE